ncbi:hypothetical protein [Olleya sp. R77988]|uniref:hypothetical protein n=1 Tax=Olleya sp. R77988 TaxID=3093875 RepID=UPI0037C5258A
MSEISIPISKDELFVFLSEFKKEFKEEFLKELKEPVTEEVKEEKEVNDKEEEALNPNFFIQLFTSNKIKEVKEDIKEIEVKEVKEEKEKETVSITNPDATGKIVDLLSSINTSIENETKKNKEKLAELFSYLKGIDEPSVDLRTFFKKYDYQVESRFENEIDSISESLKDKKYINNLKLIIKNKDKKLVADHKKYTKLLGNDFLSKIKTKEDVSFNDKSHISRVLGNVSSFIRDVTYYMPESTSNIEA